MARSRRTFDVEWHDARAPKVFWSRIATTILHQQGSVLFCRLQADDGAENKLHNAIVFQWAHADHFADGGHYDPEGWVAEKFHDGNCFDLSLAEVRSLTFKHR